MRGREVEAVFVFDRHAATDLSVAFAILVPQRRARLGRAEVPQDTVVFTVKLPAGLAARVRAHARQAGLAISAVVAQALEEFLARGHGNHPRR